MTTPRKYKIWDEDNPDYKAHVVYQHIEPGTGEIVYVGMGKYERPCNVSGRSKEHGEWMRKNWRHVATNGMPTFVRVVSRDLTYGEARP